MVGASRIDSESAVYLVQKHNSEEPVRKRKRRKGNFFIRSLFYIVRETVGAADYEGYAQS